MARASRRVKPRLEGLRPRSPAKPDWEMAHSRGWGTGRNHGMLCVGGLALVVLWCTLARAMARLRSGRGARWPALAPGSVSVELLGVAALSGSIIKRKINLLLLVIPLVLFKTQL